MYVGGMGVKYSASSEQLFEIIKRHLVSCGELCGTHNTAEETHVTSVNIGNPALTKAGRPGKESESKPLLCHELDAYCCDVVSASVSKLKRR